MATARKRPADIVLVTTDAIPGREVEAVGIVCTRAFLGGWANGMAGLRRLAAKQGADAVVGVRLAPAAFSNRAYGTAVRFK